MSIPMSDIYSSTPSDDIITLQVGTHQFQTLKQTLTSSSGYFQSLFSGRWPSQVRPDGTIFIDDNGAVFSHILDYLRHGTFPLFFNLSAGGHDHSQYAQVRAQADYFQIDALRDWIDSRGYERDITLQTTTAAMSATRLANYLKQQHRATASGERIEATYEVKQIGTRKQYVCEKGQIITTQIGTRGQHQRYCSCINGSSSYRFCGDEENPIGRLMGDENTYVVIGRSVVKGGK